ncbi:MAG: hypothetical protein GYB65_01830 [Chloroflexi bacterium]|nr:hypothetical protein [Chloroflexota bacterium]
MKTRTLLVIVALCWCVAAVALTLPGPSQPSYAQSGDTTISGTVVDVDGPLAGATVRLQATDHATQTAADGTFVLEVPGTGPYTVTAWAETYYVGWAEEVSAGATDITITLTPYYTTDNPDYTWFSTESADGSLSCAHCMPCYSEWQADAHSQSAVNPRFITMYNGTDVDGNQSPLTRYAFNRDYGSFPLPPDLSQPYYGPGYKLDFPDSAGNCGTCHIPGAAAMPGMAYAVDVNEISGIAVEGVFCEFCHKIGDVTLDPSGMPYPNMPGVLSMQLYRPDGDQQLFFGNFDDVTRRVSYLPLIEESAFCATCHFGVFWDTVIYNSYGEWLESPYSDPDTGQTCQDCHMPPVDYDYFVYPEQGGFIRDSNLILSHTMPGAADEEFLQRTAELDVQVARDGTTLTITASVTNTFGGHHIPTDSPMRQIFLLVSATDADGQPLELASGPTLPDWAGDLADLPGVYYAKILEETWTEVSPSGAYWMPTRILEDTRIPALETATSTFVFTAPASGDITINATLVYRRAFYDLAQQKGWDDPDILMEEFNLTLP